MLMLGLGGKNYNILMNAGTERDVSPAFAISYRIRGYFIAGLV